MSGCHNPQDLSIGTLNAVVAKASTSVWPETQGMCTNHPTGGPERPDEIYLEQR